MDDYSETIRTAIGMLIASTIIIALWALCEGAQSWILSSP